MNPMTPTSQQEEKKYHKKIDELIEDAEIEAEIEAEKKVRSKNTRLVTISVVSMALLAFIYIQVKMGSKTTSSVVEKPVAPLVELAREQLGSPAEPGAETPAPDSEAASSQPASEPLSPVENEAEPVAEVASAIVEPSADIKKEAPQPASETAPPPPAIEPPAKVKQTTVQAPKPPVVKKQTSESALSGKIYYVQTGVFSVSENADSLSKGLTDKGFNASIQVKDIEAIRYRVFVGGFADEAGGAQQIQDLKAKGFSPEMEKLDDNTYTIVLGKFKTSGEAEALRDKLSLNGFLSSAGKIETQTKIYVVQIGAFDNLPQAKNELKQVEKAGFPNSFIRSERKSS